MEYVVDFDDLTGENAHKLSVLCDLREKYPDFKATLFTIPNRISQQFIGEVKALGSWLALAPHGWEHTRGECLSWSVSEAVDKIKEAQDKGIDAPIFRAPAWLLAGATYEACARLNLQIASHRDFHLKSTGKTDDGVSWTNVPQYIYNLTTGRKQGVRACHGHITPVADNHILDMARDGRLSFPDKATFTWPWEASVLIT
jgi:predicted deacetylase